MDENLMTLLRSIPEKDAPQGVPCEPELIQRIENEYRITLPEDYKTFLLVVGHGTITGVNRVIFIFRAKSVLGFNEDEAFEAIPGMFAIGNDGGGALYYYDTRNELGWGNYAMFLVHAGSLTKEYSRFVGNSLTEAIKNILNGEQFYDRPTYGDSLRK